MFFITTPPPPHHFNRHFFKKLTILCPSFYYLQNEIQHDKGSLLVLYLPSTAPTFGGKRAHNYVFQQVHLITLTSSAKARLSTLYKPIVLKPVLLHKYRTESGRKPVLSRYCT